MADKLRSVNTRFWDDTFISELNPSEKLLFLYLLTNPLTNLLGIYEVSLKRISFDTGLKSDAIQKGFERFGRVKKVFFVDGFIILPNFLKNQRLNTNMKIGITKLFNQLPNELKDSILSNDSKGLPNDYQSIRNGMLKYEIEIESEIEEEKEKKKGFIPPTLIEVKEYFKTEGYKEDIAEKAWKGYDVANWVDSKGNKIKNWKQMCIHVWFKEENKEIIKIVKKKSASRGYPKESPEYIKMMGYPEESKQFKEGLK